MESKQNVEVHRVVITKHQMVIGDLKMLEEREDKTITDHASGKILDQSVTYLRQIGDHILVITEKDGNENESTILNEEQLEQFKTNWDKHWKPSITKETIQTTLQSQSNEEQ